MINNTHIILQPYGYDQDSSENKIRRYFFNLLILLEETSTSYDAYES